MTLKTKRDFDMVYKNASRVFLKSFTLYVLDLRSAGKWKNGISVYNSNMAQVIYGLSVSKKIGHAPNRNLIKRRIRALLDIYADKLSDLALIFVPKAVCDFDVLESDLLRALDLYRKYPNKRKALKSTA